VVLYDIDSGWNVEALAGAESLLDNLEGWEVEAGPSAPPASAAAGDEGGDGDEEFEFDSDSDDFEGEDEGMDGAAGAHPVITSSSDEKLLRAKALGAAAIINYKSTPEWSKAMLAATNGVGAHHILEVGGTGTLAQSLACVAKWTRAMPA
jgi:hypothetical protein